MFNRNSKTDKATRVAYFLGWTLFDLLLLFCLSLGPRKQLPYSSPSPLAKKHELYYSNLIAKKYQWKSSVLTPSRTECDIVTPTLAIEVEWSTKPYEAIGQSLHYSQELGLEPGMLFLLSSEKPDKAYVLARVGKVCRKYRISLWWYDVETGRLEKELNYGK